MTSRYCQLTALIWGGLLTTALPCLTIAGNAMVVIPGGHYTPLFKSANRSAEVEVDAFALDSFAVSNRDFLAFTKQYPRWRKTQIKPIFSDENYLKHLPADASGSGSKQPVTNVSWFAARAYCQSKDKRLPTTAEWEFAARASASAADGSEDPGFRRRILDWYARPVVDELPEVGDTAVNYWGVYGMHGVVWEMVNDFNTALVTGESRADSQLEQSLFCGAGAANSADPSDYAAFMRYALRSSYQAHYTMESLGFRCAKSLAEPIDSTANSGGESDEGS